MDSPEFSDTGLNPATPEDSSSAGPNGKVVHYYGRRPSRKLGGSGGDGDGDGRDAGRLHPKADALLLLLRFLTLAFSLSSLVVMLTDSSTVGLQRKVKWADFDAYRYVLAASAIVCLYSAAEIGLGFWYLFKGQMLMPDALAHWFDFGHDQGFAYLIFSASSAGTAVAHNLRERHILIHGMYGCDESESFCIRAEIAIGLAYGAFLFIALSSLLSGYRLAKWLILGRH